jgi:hypothetical protein
LVHLFDLQLFIIFGTYFLISLPAHQGIVLPSESYPRALLQLEDIPPPQGQPEKKLGAPITAVREAIQQGTSSRICVPIALRIGDQPDYLLAFHLWDTALVRNQDYREQRARQKLAYLPINIEAVKA